MKPSIPEDKATRIVENAKAVEPGDVYDSLVTLFSAALAEERALAIHEVADYWEQYNSGSLGDEIRALIDRKQE